MTATVEIPFAEGQEVWWAGNASEKVTVECPECCGTRAITMVKGNGEEVSLACGMCSLGFDPPRGTITEWVWNHAPQKLTLGPLTSVDNHGPDGATRYCYGSFRSEDLFNNEGPCQLDCNRRNTERAEQVEKQAIARLESKRSNLAHSASYWATQCRTIREDLKRAEARLAACKKTPK